MSKPILTVESMLAWAERQPPGKAYDYTDHSGCRGEGCPGFQYLTAMGVSVYGFGALMWGDMDRHYRAVPLAIDAALHAEPWTFGALAERLREVSR